MTYVAILLNFIVFVWLLYLLIVDGVPSGDGAIILFIVLFSAIVNLLTIFGSKGDSWLSLYLKRKALEEKKKIEKLKS